MAKIWRNRIEAGTQSFDKCPELYRNTVEALMREDVVSGVLTEQRFEELTGLAYNIPVMDEGEDEA